MPPKALLCHHTQKNLRRGSQGANAQPDVLISVVIAFSHVPGSLGKNFFGKPEAGCVFFLCLYNTEVLICGYDSLILSSHK